MFRSLFAVLALSLLSATAVAHECEPSKPVSRSEAAPNAHARTLPGAVMRGSPVLNSPESLPVPTGTQVRLVSPLKNLQGNWWFVTASGIGGGWMRDVEMANYTR